MKLCIIPTYSICRTDGDFLRLARSLPFGECEYDRLISIKNKDLATQSLCARLALMRLCGDDDHGEIVRNEFGKPYFSSSIAPRFSLSHTNGLSIAAISEECEVGVDVETIREYGFDGIAKRFFTPDERLYLEEKGNSADAFFAVWTKKEAVAKLDGRGLSAIIATEKSPSAHTKHFEINFNNSRAILCVASSKEIGQIEIARSKEFDIYELQN